LVVHVVINDRYRDVPTEKHAQCLFGTQRDEWLITEHLQAERALVAPVRIVVDQQHCFGHPSGGGWTRFERLPSGTGIEHRIEPSLRVVRHLSPCLNHLSYRASCCRSITAPFVWASVLLMV